MCRTTRGWGRGNLPILSLPFHRPVNAYADMASALDESEAFITGPGIAMVRSLMDRGIVVPVELQRASGA